MSTGQGILLFIIGIAFLLFGVAPAIVYLIGRIIKLFNPHSIAIPDDYFEAVDGGFMMLVFVCLFAVCACIGYAIIKFW